MVPRLRFGLGNECKKEPGLADILQAQAGTKYCSPSSEDFLRFEASGVEAASPSSPPACLGRLTPLARPDLPLSQEQGNTDTEIVAATRFAALHSSLFRPILENQSGQPILMPNNPRKRCFFCLGPFGVHRAFQVLRRRLDQIVVPNKSAQESCNAA